PTLFRSAAVVTAVVTAVAVRRAGRRGQRRVPVRVQRDAEGVPVAVRRRRQGAAGAGDRGVPAVLQTLPAACGDPHAPVVRSADGEVDVEPVVPRLAAADVHGAGAVAVAVVLGRGAVAAGAERDVRAAAALVPLRGHDLVVVVAEVHAVGRPGVEVVARRDGATGALLLAHAPVL